MSRQHIILILASSALVLLLWLSSQPTTPPAPEAVAKSNSVLIRNARLFDGETLLTATDLRVENGVITEIGSALKAPANVEVIDAKGKTLLPGLIDAHVHVWGEAQRQMLRFGVTTGLDMFSDHREQAARRAQRESLDYSERGDIWSAGTLVTAKGGHGTQFGLAVDTVDTLEQVVPAVQARIAQGSDFIKLVYDNGHAYGDSVEFATLDRERVAALIAAAHAGQRMALVHVAEAAAARESVEAGADGLVHVFHDRVADAELVDLFKQRDAFVIPTLSVVASLAGDTLGKALADEPALAEALDAQQRGTLRQGFPAGMSNPTHLQHALDSVRALHAAGVDLLVGTDAGNPGTAHGASMHGELELMVRAGLSPNEALRAATVLPARRFGLADRGRLQVGLRADLLLVEGDPLADIRTTRRVAGVWKNGYPIDTRAAVVSTSAHPALAPLRLDFDHAEQALSVPGSAGWREASDQFMGGASSAALAWSAQGEAGQGGALRVSGELKAGANYPFAGAMLFLAGQPMQPVNGSALRELRFRARGDGRTYQVLLFSGPESQQMPQIQHVTPGREWSEHRVVLADFAGADLAQLRAIAFTASLPAGEFELMLDQVQLQ